MGGAPKLNDPVDRFCGSFKLFLPDGGPLPRDRSWMAVAVLEERAVMGEPAVIERPDGGRLTVLVYANPLRDLSKRVIGGVTVLVDITERTHLEEQLRQSQKMEAIGQFTGGIAHDFNNLLTVIKGYSQLAAASLNPAAPEYSDIQAISEAGNRAAALTSQLLALGRKQTCQRYALEINPIVAGMGQLLRRLLRSSISLVLTLPPSARRVKADQGQIEQVIMNLAINARDAMPTGGTLTIETGDVELDEAPAAPDLSAPPGSYVMLVVSDTGCGMDKPTQARIFEPFFTTKATGKGTGLGLATVYNIINQSGGYISCRSKPGCGTTFTLYLPISMEDPAPVQPVLAASDPAANSETILVAEDEELVRQLLQAILSTAGYRVLAAQDAHEAIRIAQTAPTSPHLLVTDIVMPEMSGFQLSKRVLALGKGIKVLYMSGYPSDIIAQYSEVGAEAVVLQKPFSPSALLRKVREALDRSATL